MVGVGVGSVMVIDCNLDWFLCVFVFGATHVVTSVDELDCNAWEVVIDVIGVVLVIEDGFKCVCCGGMFLMFGVVFEDAMVMVLLFWIYNDEICIIGSMAVLHLFERVCDLLVAGVIDAGALLTYWMVLGEYPMVIDVFCLGVGFKIQVVFE